MRIGKYIFFFFAVIYNYGIAQSYSIQDAILHSAEHFVLYSDSVYAHDIGNTKYPNKKYLNRDKDYFVLNSEVNPSLIYRFDNKITANGRKMIWCTSRIEKSFIERKTKSETFHFYYRVTLNVETDGIAIYVQNGYKRKVNGSGARYTYSLINGKYHLKSIATDISMYKMNTICNDTTWSVLDATRIYDRIIRNAISNENVKKLLGDTINILYNHKNYLVEYENIGMPLWVDGCKLNPVNFFNGYSFLKGSGRKCLAMSYSIDKNGEIICYVLTVAIRKKNNGVHNRVYKKRVEIKYLLKIDNDDYKILRVPYRKILPEQMKNK